MDGVLGHDLPHIWGQTPYMLARGLGKCLFQEPAQIALCGVQGRRQTVSAWFWEAMSVLAQI